MMCHQMNMYVVVLELVPVVGLFGTNRAVARVSRPVEVNVIPTAKDDCVL